LSWLLLTGLFLGLRKVMASRKRRSNSGSGIASDEMAEETEEEAEHEEDEIDEADAEDTGGEVSNAADCALGDLAGCIL